VTARHVVAFAFLVAFAPVARAQGPVMRSSDIAPFLGTWVLTMTNPPNATETVRIWDDSGTARASFQSNRSAAINATGMMKDGDVLVLTLSRFENGKPDRAVVALTIDGDTMNISQMLEFSQTIKRGSGKKQ
jgi:hypothetical protein